MMRLELLWVVAAVISAMSELGFPLENSTSPTYSAQPENITQWHQTLEIPQITYPSRLVGRTSGSETPRNQLDTRVRNETNPDLPAHLASVSFLVPAFRKEFILELELNHHLLSSRYVEIHYNEHNNTRVQIPGATEDHCYYSGGVRGLAASWVAISTCHGLSGAFSDGLYTYTIYPQEQSTKESLPWPHVIQRTRTCTEPDCEHPTDIPRSSKIRRKRQVRQIVRSALSETKYIELMVVNDRRLLDQRQSLGLTISFAKSVVNYADTMEDKWIP